MTEITTDQLRDLSVKVVEGFINNKVDLSKGIAKYASEMELNSDQTKRLVESSNTIAYLKLQKEASDRTFEFKVADYNEVLGHMCLPSENEDKHIIQTDEGVSEGQTKEAFSLSDQELTAIAMKEFRKNRHELTKLAFVKAEIAMTIGDTVEKLKKDPLALEKLAEVTTPEEFKKISSLLGPTRELEERIFKTAELYDAQTLVDLVKQAYEVVEQEKNLNGLEKKASGFFGKGVSHAIGSAVGGTLGAVGGIGAAGIGALAKGTGKLARKVDPLNATVSVGAAALTDVNPKTNVWDNLQGSQKRF